MDSWGDVGDVEAEELGGDDKSVVEVPAKPPEWTKAGRLEVVR